MTTISWWYLNTPESKKLVLFYWNSKKFSRKWSWFQFWFQPNSKIHTPQKTCWPHNKQDQHVIKTLHCCKALEGWPWDVFAWFNEKSSLLILHISHPRKASSGCQAEETSSLQGGCWLWFSVPATNKSEPQRADEEKAIITCAVLYHCQSKDQLLTSIGSRRRSEADTQGGWSWDW